MRIGCNNYSLGTWFQLSRLCSVMLLPEHFMICPDRIHIFVQESLCQTHLRIRGPKLALYEGSFKKGLGRWGLSIGSQAQGPYRSWDLDAVQLLLQKHSHQVIKFDIYSLLGLCYFKRYQVLIFIHCRTVFFFYYYRRTVLF